MANLLLNVLAAFMVHYGPVFKFNGHSLFAEDRVSYRFWMTNYIVIFGWILTAEYFLITLNTCCHCDSEISGKIFQNGPHDPWIFSLQCILATVVILMPHNTYHLECPGALLLCFLCSLASSSLFSSSHLHRLHPMLSLSLLQEVDVGLVAGMIWCHSWAWTCTALSCSAAHSDLLPSPWSGWVTGGFLGWVYLEPCLYFVGPLGRCSVRGVRLCCVYQMLQILVRLDCSFWNTEVSSQLLQYIILQSRWLHWCTYRELFWTMSERKSQVHPLWMLCQIWTMNLSSDPRTL